MLSPAPHMSFTYTHTATQLRVTVQPDGTLLFVVPDLAKALRRKNASSMISAVDAEHKTYVTLPDRAKQYTAITLAGVRQVLDRHRPGSEARQFESWLHSTVLPACASLAPLAEHPAPRPEQLSTDVELHARMKELEARAVRAEEECKRLALRLFEERHAMLNLLDQTGHTFTDSEMPPERTTEDYGPVPRRAPTSPPTGHTGTALGNKLRDRIRNALMGQVQP